LAETMLLKHVLSRKKSFLASFVPLLSVCNLHLFRTLLKAETLWQLLQVLSKAVAELFTCMHFFRVDTTHAKYPVTVTG